MKTFTKFMLFAIVVSLFIGSTAFGQITQVTSPQSATTTGTTLTITRPSALAVNDVMIANIVQSDNDGNTLNDASLSGWNLIDGRDIGVNGNDHWRGTVLYKVATASDVSAASFVFTLDADAEDGTAGAIVAFRNVDVTGGVTATGTPGGPFDVDPGAINTSGNADINVVTATGITTATANAAVIMLTQLGNNRTHSNWLTTSPGSLSTESYDVDNNTGLDNGIGAAWALKTSAGSTGAGTVDLSGNARNGGILIALKAFPPPPSVTLTPSSTQYILVGGSVNFTATALNYTGSGNYTYTWTAAGATISGSNPNSIAAASDSKILTYAAAGTFTVNVSIARSGSGTLTTNTTTVVVAAAPAVANLWASSSNGTQISSFTVINGIYVNGPTNLFVPTFPGTTTGGTTTAALGRNDQGGPANGYYYWLPNTSGNGGVVEVFAATSTGATPTRIGSVDINGGSTNSLGFVRLGMGPDGKGWILAGDATNLYLAKFVSDGVNLVTITTVPIVLSGGLISTFQNGDVCVLGNNSLYALANNGSGVTQIFIGSLNDPTVTITKRWDLVDQSNAPFSGTVNGVAFDEVGSLYISTGNGLFFINQATVNGPAGTVQCSLVSSQTGLQDLASNFFPQGSTLPVTLVTFLGNYRNENATLIWETENLSNFSHFEIQRSSTGSNFITVGSINKKGDGLSRTQYQFIDNLSGINGTIFYYKLKMVDANGQFKYSNVVLIRKEQKNGTNLVITPNPVMSGVKATANFTAAASSKVVFKIIDMSGKVVLTQQNNVLQGNNSVSINSLDRLQSGIYMLQLNNGQSMTTTKFYIVH